ncbi:hypothetical protein ABFS83_03G124200 [Erythranthe nasuta]
MTWLSFFYHKLIFLHISTTFHSIFTTSSSINTPTIFSKLNLNYLLLFSAEQRPPPPPLFFVMSSSSNNYETVDLRYHGKICSCGRKAVIKIVETEKPSKGRLYFGCSDSNCGFQGWCILNQLHTNWNNII